MQMLKHLQTNVYQFAAAKNRNEMKLLTTAITDEKGAVRSFNDYKKEAAKIMDSHRGQYLRAEYNLAVAGGQMSSKWADFEPDDLLQYSTAGDARVRDDHKALDGIIKPAKDAFWNQFYPPNGWNCRCDVDRVIYGSITPDDELPSNDSVPPLLRTNLAKNGLVFPEDHPYFKDSKKTDPITFAPSNLDKYEKKYSLKVKRDIFSKLKNVVPLKHTGKGAYYHPVHDVVNIPHDARRKASKWYAEAVVYHEYGHAVDFHNGLQTNKHITGLMNKHRKVFAKGRNKGYKEIDARLLQLGFRAFKNKNHDLLNMVGAAHDTLKALNPKYGRGHSLAYFKRKGNKEAEFIAHLFENFYIGNPVFKKVMPELYDEMVETMSKLKL